MSDTEKALRSINSATETKVSVFQSIFDFQSMLEKLRVEENGAMVNKLTIALMKEKRDIGIFLNDAISTALNDNLKSMDIKDEYDPSKNLKSIVDFLCTRCDQVIIAKGDSYSFGSNTIHCKCGHESTFWVTPTK